MLHSKLASKEWPSLSKLLNKMLIYVPLANIQVNIYDKELEGEEPKKNFEEVKEDDFNYSRYENIKINLYNLNIEELKYLYDKANDEVQFIVNPKRRIEYLQNSKMKILEEKPSLYQEVSYRSTLRPITGKSVNSSKISKMHESVMSRTTNMNHQSVRPNSTTSIFKSTRKSGFHQSGIRHGSQIDLEDSDTIAQLKGNLYRTLFTNKNGWINLTDIPYDSYLIEIEESKNFLASAAIITFPKILPSKDIKRYFGLKHQVNAYTEIYLYHYLDKKEDSDFNMQLLEGANIILIRSNSGNFGSEEGKFLTQFT